MKPYTHTGLITDNASAPKHKPYRTRLIEYDATWKDENGTLWSKKSGCRRPASVWNAQQLTDIQPIK